MADSGPVTSRIDLVSSIVRVQRKSEHTGFQAIDGLVFSLGLIALGYNRRDSVHGDGQLQVVGASPDATILRVTNEQHALLIPDMAVEKQTWDERGRW